MIGYHTSPINYRKKNMTPFPFSARAEHRPPEKLPSTLILSKGGTSVYNHLLDTFIAVANTGSFSAAARILFVSPTAVIKKINSLEDEYGITLVKRTHYGVELTEAGKALYQDAKYIRDYSNLALSRAQSKSMEQTDRTVRIGKSLNTPCDLLVQFWPLISAQDPSLKIDVISFENSTEQVKLMFKNLGNEIDAYIGLLDSRMLQQRRCIGLRLSQEPLRLGVPFNHPLASTEEIRLSDLHGRKLFLVQEGRFLAYDALRRKLEENYPSIQIIDCETVRLEEFNQCEDAGGMIVTIDPWKDIHPLFKTIPVAWDFSTPFGIVCSERPSLKMQHFLQAVETVVGAKEEDKFYHPKNAF